jgi:hypothetical protein
MKRLLLITAVTVAVALIPLAAQAQHGGGGHGGGAVSHAGSGMARGSAGMRSSAMSSHTPIPGQRAFSPNNRFTVRFHTFPNSHFFFRNNRFFFNSCFNRFGSFGGFGCSSGLYGGYPYYYPYSDFDNYFGQQQQQQQQPVAVENDDSNDREVAFQMQAMRDEMRAMREEQHLRDEARNNPPKPESDDGNATLVFRDGRQLSVRNYAVADHTIWILGPEKARKVQVSELDIPATEQINAKNGVEFHLPH